MKRSAVVNSLELLLFVVLLAGALLLLNPVSKRVENELAHFRDSLTHQVEELTGLHFSYTALSPSIFRSLKLTDLVITDVSNGTILARIANVSVSYDLFALLRGDMNNVFTEIIVQNGFVSFDREKNSTIITLLSSLAGESNSSDLPSQESKKTSLSDTPLNVTVRNLDITYTDVDQKMVAHIGKGLALIASEGINVELESKIVYTWFGMNALGPLHAGLSIRGSINNAFDSGSASLVIQNLEGKQFSVSRLGLITSYRNGSLSVNSVQDLQPVDINLLWDLQKNELSASLTCENLFPFKLVRITDKESAFGQLNNTIVSGTAMVKSTQENGLEYAVKMKGEIPKSFMQGGSIVVDCSGSSKKADFNTVSVTGASYDISFSGSLDLEKMIPDGFLSVKKLKIPSGPLFSGDMFIQPLKSGFTCLVPELYIDTSHFTSIVLDVSPETEALDFTLSAFDKSGHISADGSFIYGSHMFLQLYAAFDSISVSNTTSTVLSFVTPGQDSTVQNSEHDLDPYALTTEVYFSTDFTNLSFNCTRLVLASAEKDGLFVLLSVKGNQSGIDITDITFSFSDFDISGNVHAGFESSGDIFLSSSLMVNSIPYGFSGIYSNQLLSLTGDYNLSAALLFDPKNGINGSLRLDGLPVPISPLLLSCSLDAAFTFTSDFSWKITLNNGSVQDMSGFLPLSTLVEFQGSADATGVSFDRFTVSDEASQVTGFAGFTVIPGVPGSEVKSRYKAEVGLESLDSKESYQLSGDIAFSDDLFFNIKATVTESPLMRFIKDQKSENRLSATLALSGTPSALFASADIGQCVYKISGFDLDSRGKLLLEDKIVTLSNAGLSWNGHTLTDLKGSVSLDTLQASVESGYEGVLGQSGLSARLGVVFTTESNGSFADLSTLLTRFTIQTTVSDINWNTMVSNEPLVCSFVHEPGITALYAGKNDSVTGFLLDDGTFSFQSSSSTPVQFYADGKILDSVLEINVSDFHTDLDVLWPYTGLGIVTFHDGSIDGNFTLSGLLNDPEFHGELRASEIVVSAPGFVGETYGPVAFDILAEGKTLTVPSFITKGKEGAFSTEAVVEFDRWIPSDVTVKTATLAGKPVKLDADNFLFVASGYASYDVVMSITPIGLDLSGSAEFERGSFAILFSGLAPQAPNENASPFDIRMNLSLAVGKKVEFRYPNNKIPIIRGLVQADNPIILSLDTARSLFSIKGSANLKAGEIFYIKRNFYLKQGNITFNENQDLFDPMITIRAEIRERDDAGEPVRIILSVENQPLSTFVPVLTSDPPKTNAEMYVLLGQVASADTSSETVLKNTVISASDIFTQMSIFRKVENNIRDAFNLDIFSIRTLIIQNAILGQSNQSSTDAPMTVGNYFDNTTVYMGKYLGSAIYADALMHFSYYDPKSAQNVGNEQAFLSNLLFQPELGLEVTTPFFLLRWAIAPSNPATLFVADNSLRLSWKFSY